MLSAIEKIVFTIGILGSIYLGWRGVNRISRLIRQGHSSQDRGISWRRVLGVFIKIVTMRPTFNLRPAASLVHLIIAWGFGYYLLVNLGDVITGYIPVFHFLGTGLLGSLYRLGTDLLSIAILLGMVYFLIRRFLIRPDNLTTREEAVLNPRARIGIARDSLVVGVFILTHVGARFFGETFRLALEGSDPWQPCANMVSRLWVGWAGLETAQHAAFWLALGSIMTFIPYFPYSKHIHLFFAPLSFLVKPEQGTIGELDMIDFEDESLEEFGVTQLFDLNRDQLLDPYACIMCYRCQEVCPAYCTGKPLSPAVLEINKRYHLNGMKTKTADELIEDQPLISWAITTEALWACTSCGACIEICPVNNEPMVDIIDIRRAQVLKKNDFPKSLQPVFRHLERTMNPWGAPPGERMGWARGLDVPRIEENPTPDVLWWVGCAPAFDARSQKTAVAFTKILRAAGVNYAVLGEAETCTGDAARRAGREDIFYELAQANVELLNQATPKKIVTTCPHCLQVLKHEYPTFGGIYQVVHHSQFIQELLESGRLVFVGQREEKLTAYHDPCYLARYNGIIEPPRSILRQVTHSMVELEHNKRNTFCCGAGGAGIWKEEERGEIRIADHRFEDAQKIDVEVLALGCPFCLTMLADAAKDTGSSIQVRDIAEIVAERILE